MDPLVICARREKNEEDLVADRFAVNLDEMAASSGAYGDVADAATRIPADVNDKIGDPNTIAGDDQYGALFANRIAPAIEGAGQLLHGVGDGLHNTSKMILTTVGFYAKANDVATDQAHNLTNHTINP
jgi:hypothetical protein